MANAIKQFRYYGDGNDSEGNEKNWPTGLTAIMLKSGTIFEDYFPILQLGIQALPGTMFYLNNSEDPVRIGRTGVYELDLTGNTEISSLSFDADSLKIINNGEGQAYLIIDIVYDNGEA